MSPNFDRANRRAVRLADVTSTSALLPPVARPRLGVVVDYADDFRDAVADVVDQYMKHGLDPWRRAAEARRKREKKSTRVWVGVRPVRLKMITRKTTFSHSIY